MRRPDFYSIGRFIRTMEHFSRQQTIERAQQECTRMARKLRYRVRRAPRSRRPRGSDGRYYAQVCRFRFFLEYESLPYGVTQYEMAIYRPLCERLVRKGELPPSTLTLLDASN